MKRVGLIGWRGMVGSVLMQRMLEERDIANPLATILSVSMMLRYSFSQATAADAIEQAVSKVLDQGLRTGDIWSEGCRKVGTREMGDAVVAALKNL